MNRKREKRFCSGQATTEMAVMLLAFVILMLGLIFVFSLGIFNTKVLMNAKYNADIAANGDNAVNAAGAGRELRGWEYQNGIPFTLKDEPVYFSGTEMEDAYSLMDVPHHSEAKNYTYEWTKLSGFPQGKLTHDYKDLHPSTISAAGLVAAEGVDENAMPLVSRLPELFATARKLLRVKISKDALVENNSNRVYMPANGEL